MKKKLLLAAIATVALVSCSQDEAIEVNKGRAIDFRVSAEMSTRGTAVESADAMRSFKVTALKDAETVNYFTNQVWTYAESAWTTPDPAYWPNDKESLLQFFAYYPTDLPGVTIDSKEQKISDFTPAQKVAEQVDLLTAYGSGTRAKNEAKGVTLNFDHALSQIVVQAQNHNANYKILVKGIKLAQIPSTADMEIPNENDSEDTDKFNYQVSFDEDGKFQLNDYILQKAWSKPTGNKYYTVSKTTDGDDVVLLRTDTEAKSLMFNDGAFMMIPQQLTGYAKTTAENGAYISVLCKIYRVDGNNSTIIYPIKKGVDAGEKYAYAMIPIDTNWEPGKKYTYTLNFFKGSDGGAGTVDPNPDEGADLDGDGTPDDDIDTNPEPEGGAGENDEIIAGKYIKFNVTVDKWIEGTTENKKM